MINKKVIEAMLRKHGDQFAGNYHHYSENLFILAAQFLKEGQFAVDAGSYLGDNAFAMANKVGEDGRLC